MSRPEQGAEQLSFGQAFALGALHGPAELLPISSSGHLALVPWLFSSRYSELDPELRKSFEVALHAGTAAALLLGLRAEVSEAVDSLDGRGGLLLAVSSIPPAIVGYTLERFIEQQLGTPTTTAAGLLAGSLAIVYSDRSPQLREYDQIGVLDALLLGFAQAVALIPGVSRNGATLAAARARRFKRADANRLSRHVAFPVIAGGTLLKAARLGRSGMPRGMAVRLAVGAAAAFLSTLGSTWLIGQVERDRPLRPYAIYRVVLAGVVLAKLQADR
jgi:undecaprenyl-diphosphatase